MSNEATHNFLTKIPRGHLRGFRNSSEDIGVRPAGQRHSDLGSQHVPCAVAQVERGFKRAESTSVEPQQSFVSRGRRQGEPNSLSNYSRVKSVGCERIAGIETKPHMRCVTPENDQFPLRRKIRLGPGEKLSQRRGVTHVDRSRGFLEDIQLAGQDVYSLWMLSSA